MEALGMIQTRGLAAAIEAADAAVKAASVVLAGYENSGSAIITVMLRGSVADCKYAVDAGSDAAAQTGELLKGFVIPYPYEDLEGRLPINL